MGSLQKKEMEMSCKLIKKEMLVLQGHSSRIHSSPIHKKVEVMGSHCRRRRRHSLSLDMERQPNGTIERLSLSQEGCLKSSPAVVISQQVSSDQDQNVSSDPRDDSFSALGACLNAPISEPSNGTLKEKIKDDESAHKEQVKPGASENNSSDSRKDESCTPVTTSDSQTVHSGNGRFSCSTELVPSLLESIRKQELSLSNLTLSDPMSLTNISRKSSLINILNYFPEKTPVICPRKKLLILDINGILADIVYPPPKGYKADTKIAGRAVFTRPFCSDFLYFCLERFNVAIWSSRSRKIIDRLVNYLMGDMKHKLIFCWDLSHCTQSNFRTLENKHKALVFKELRKVWDSYDSDLPWEKDDFNEANTVLLDDTPYKALLNPPHTAIFPYSYDFKYHGDTAIGPGGHIRAYLEDLAAADNVQKYVKEHPFGQSAITERSLAWQFYDKVIKEQSGVPAGG